MEFNKPYNRTEFVTFLRTKFLPEDFVQEEEPIGLSGTNYATSAIKLGTSESLQLVVYEVKHNSRHDARVGLSRDAFRMLADEYESRALVLFVPEDSNDNYRFSFIELSLTPKDDSSRLTRTYSNPRRYSYYLGTGISYYTPNKYLNEAGRVQTVNDLKERFSVEVLTKAFYKELSNWYAWAIDKVHYPNDIEDPTDNEKYNHESTIRLITRLIFVWFLKQRGLIPWQFFDEQYIAEHLIKGFTPNANVTLFGKSEDSHYYKGILQNLFFAMLNSPLTADGSTEVNQRHFRKLNDNGTASRSDFDNNKLMRYEELFIDPQHFVDLANSTVPFLNGGLFDCLDDKINGMYLDAFTDNDVISRQLIIPDYLFFGEEVGKDVDLSKYYGDKSKKSVSTTGIIDLLKRYNFTVEENTPFDQDVSLDPELLGQVFENLLAAFNPETQTTARKQTGSFYTPREIVQYMVDESLVAHLCRTVDKTLEPKFRQLVQYTDEDLGLSLEQRKAIMQSLYNCKVLDPACGSGAFPVGMLQQMVHVLNRIDPDNAMWKEMMKKNAGSEASEAYMAATDEERKEILSDIDRSFDESVNRPDYARKLYLIENCIYGVDIQPIAIQISKLRFFISLVVDQKINSNPADNFGIRPLPNLEAKFVAANSLLDLEKNEVGLFDLDEIKAKENLLKIAKHKIFSAKTVKTKRKWKERVAVLRQEIADLLLDADVIGNDTARELASWDMFSQNISSPFFNIEWMFGLTTGFDIVIANPPYVDAKKLKSQASTLKKYRIYTGTADLFTYFYELAFNLAPNGIVAFITSNKWMRSEYGRNLRRLILSKHLISLIDFNQNRLFNATVDTNILIASANEIYKKCRIYNVQTIDKKQDLHSQILNGFTEGINLTENAWLLAQDSRLDIKNKIESVGKPLKQCEIRINYGIKSGLNEAFIINDKVRNQILSNCISEKERQKAQDIIIPVVKGKNASKYRLTWNNLYLIGLFPARKLNIDAYQAIKNYLLTFRIERLEQTGKIYVINGEEIRARKRSSNLWFETQDTISYWEDLAKPKIIWQAISKQANFAFDRDGRYCSDVTTFFMVGENLEYILSILNSKLFEYALIKIYLEGDTFKSKNSILQDFHIPIAEENTILKLKSLVNEIIEYPEKQDDIQQQIDSIVYKLYHLTYDEVKIVDPQTSITKESYDVS
jgi:hypothetical protein